MARDSIVIVGAARTPVGSFNGAFANTPAHDLGAVAIKAALERAKVDGAEVDEVILGQILTAGQGQNPARQAAMAAGIPQEKTAWGLNQLCGSGLRTVAIGMQQIANGDANIIVAGGQESMSLGAARRLYARRHQDGRLQVHRHHAQGRPDGRLQRLPHGHHRRERRPELAAHPRGAGPVRRRLAEQGRGRPEGRPLQGRDRRPSRSRPARATSSSTRTSTSAPAPPSRRVAKLRPAFSKDGTVTAGNASGINDGAAALVLMTAAEAEEARPHAARPHRLLGDRRRRSGDHGHGPDPGLPQGAREGRLEGVRTSTSSRRTRPSRPRRSRSTRTWAGIRRS